jgi:outer membrane protein
MAKVLIATVKPFSAEAVEEMKSVFTEAGYEVGTRTTVDVLNVRRDLFGARRDYASSRYDYILSSLRLKQAAGTISVDDLGKINQWLGE